MQAGPAAGPGVRPARSLAVALLLGGAALVGVYLTQGESAPSVGAVLPVFPLLEEAAALQVPLPVSNTPRLRPSVDRRSAIAAGFGIVAASATPAWAEDAKAEEAAPAAVEAPAPKKKDKGALLSPYTKPDPKAFGGNSGGGPVVMGYPEVKQKQPFGIVDEALKPVDARGKPKNKNLIQYAGKEEPPPGDLRGQGDLSTADALALIKNSGARTFGNLAEGVQSGGGWMDHMEATKKQTERLYAAAAERKATIGW